MWRPLIFVVLVGINAVDGRLSRGRWRAGVQSDESSYSVCRAGHKIPLRDDTCKYRECRNRVYETVSCPEGMSFRASAGACVADGGCTKSYDDKGVADWNTSTCGIDLVLLLDMSKSISPENKHIMKTVIRNVLFKFDIGPSFTLVACSTYGAETHPMVYFSSWNKEKNIEDAINKMVMNPNPGTATWLALKEAREVMLRIKSGRRKDKKAVVIVMTDGCSNPPEMSDETIAEAHKLKDPKSYEDGVEPPEVFLMELPNGNLDDDQSGVSAAKREMLQEIKKKEFEAIPSKPENRVKAEFNNIMAEMKPILQSSCKEVKTPGQ